MGKSASKQAKAEAAGNMIQADINEIIKKLKDKLSEDALSIVVLGASGHLAKIKTYPALFALFQYDVLPPETKIIGYARSDLDMGTFHDRISTKLDFKSDDEKKKFLSMCHYHRGQYDSMDDFKKLDAALTKLESGKKSANRLFYYAIPPNVFGAVSANINKGASSNGGWTRAIIEKPFGRSLETSNELAKEILAHLQESQIYRIDHYLAKELVQNIMALRFSNPAFRSIWNRKHVSSVRISFKESAGVEGRGGYYDKFGAIRDVMQNHLLQVLSLVAMEQPAGLGDDEIRDAKVNVLKRVKALEMKSVITGQYISDGNKPGYLDDETVDNSSVTETFCQFVVYVDNDRWRGVPFLCKAGKGLDERRAEVRLQMKQPEDSIYKGAPGNELVIRIQPDEAIWLRMNNKKPGLSTLKSLVHAELDLTYSERFDMGEKLPDAYTRLILDALRGDHSLFVRSDELQEAWRIVDPILTKIHAEKIKPLPYARGSRGPPEADVQSIDSGFIVPKREGYTWRRNSVGQEEEKSPFAVAGGSGNVPKITWDYASQKPV